MIGTAVVHRSGTHLALPAVFFSGLQTTATHVYNALSLSSLLVGKAQDLFKYSRLELVLSAREKHTQGTMMGGQYGKVRPWVESEVAPPLGSTAATV